MRKKNIKKKLALAACTVLACVTAVTCLPACSGDAITEDTPLRISTDALDGVFNPFFSTSGADSSVVAQTQISMLATDKDGNIVANADDSPEAVANGAQPTVVSHYSSVTTGSKEVNGNDYDNYYTTYYFAIKDNIKFSDGVPLTIHDVLFNLYMYLDRAYSGSSTMYSTKIKGLQRYRTQTEDENQQEQIDNLFTQYARTIMQNIVEWADEDAGNPMSDLNNSYEFDEGLRSKTYMEYIEQSKSYFKEEMNTDWASAEGSVDSESYKEMGLTEPWQIFLQMYSEIEVQRKSRPDGSHYYEPIQYNGWDSKSHNKDDIINEIFNNFYSTSSPTGFKDSMRKLFGYKYATSQTIEEYIASDLMGKYFADTGITYKNVSGITVEKMSSIPTQTGTPINLGKELDVLKIVIDGVDPKAIYNFSFEVAPLHYYSTPELVEKAMAADVYSAECADFGVEYASADFMNSVRQKLVPVGAGPYKANVSDPNASNALADFYNNSIVNFVRNDDFVLGQPKIKYIQYKTISSNQKFDMVTGKTKEIDYADPNATQDNINRVKNMKTNGEGIDFEQVSNLGYGYIGVNARYVKDINIRKAIMTAFNPDLAIAYYGGAASPIYRPMSIESWAYPTGCKSVFWGDTQFATSDEFKTAAIAAVKPLVQAAGFTNPNSNGTLQNAADDTLKYTFTIAGDTEDHPAAQTLRLAAEILNECGFEITVTKDSNALRKLQQGTLEVWAAAWSSTIDPDMYQVYHMDSKATSVLNWGYNAILNDTSYYYQEYDIIEKLSRIIDQAREIDDKEARKEMYSTALDYVMDLYVEFPLYQRDNLFVWNTSVIKNESLHLEDVTAFRSPLSNIWQVELNISK